MNKPIDIHLLFPKVVARATIPLSTDEEAKLNVAYDNTEFVPTRQMDKDSGHDVIEMSYGLDVLNNLPWLADKINNTVNSFKVNMMRWEKTEFRLSTSWFTKTKPGQYSNMHKHANNIYTGVYYWGNEEPCEITLEDYDPGHHWEIAPEEYNPLNRSDWSFKMGNYELLIFPSEVHHKIQPWHGKGIRKSLAINWSPYGEVGFGDSKVFIK